MKHLNTGTNYAILTKWPKLQDEKKKPEKQNKKSGKHLSRCQ